LSAAPLAAQVEGVVLGILGGQADSATLAAMLSVRKNDGAAQPADGERRLRELLAVALASPEFQRR
jgi:hypothetical protein